MKYFVRKVFKPVTLSSLVSFFPMLSTVLLRLMPNVPLSPHPLSSGLPLLQLFSASRYNSLAEFIVSSDRVDQEAAVFRQRFLFSIINSSFILTYASSAPIDVALKILFISRWRRSSLLVQQPTSMSDMGNL